MVQVYVSDPSRAGRAHVHTVRSRLPVLQPVTVRNTVFYVFILRMSDQNHAAELLASARGKLWLELMSGPTPLNSQTDGVG